MIKEFRGENYFLSNFSFGLIQIGNLGFWNAEAAFHSYKDLSKQHAFQSLKASEAKRYGRQVKLRADWEIIKDELMYQIITEKFGQNLSLKEKLLATGEQELEEGNIWHDNYWGNCSCNKCKNIVGLNKLGHILMRVRGESSTITS